MSGMGAVTIPIGRASTVSSQGQVTLPAKVRELLDIKPGEKITWLVRKMKNGKARVIGAKPGRWPDDYYGIAKGTLDKYGGVDAYLKRERDSWD